MAGEGEGTGEGTGQGTGAGTGQQGGEFRAQFPADLKDHEAFKPYKTIGDLGKAHIDLLGKAKNLDGMTARVGELEGQLKNFIPKLPDNPTPEQTDAYLKALGRPDKLEEYGLAELAKADGVESDPKTVSWAQGLFHRVGLSKNQAHEIAKDWNKFLVEVVNEEEKIAQREAEEAEKTFKSGFKSEDEYKAAKEISKRYWKKLTGVDYDQYCSESGHPDALLMKFIYENAKKTGEDFILPGSEGGTGEIQPGMVYDKRKFPKQQKFV